MPRRPNTRPTTIYWLVDTRPETIAIGWPTGYPFYCGKTVFSVERRLGGHRRAAVLQPHRPISQWITACGNFIRVHVVEVVPLGQSWVDGERRWIKCLRANFPICVNVNDGGEGMPGYVQSDELRKAVSKFHKGRKRSAKTRARISAVVTERYRREREKKGVFRDTTSSVERRSKRHLAYIKRQELVKKRTAKERL